MAHLSYRFCQPSMNWHGKGFAETAEREDLKVKATAQVFLSYAREDEGKVEELYQKLSDVGFKP